MRDLLGKVIILVAANPYSLPPDFRKLPVKFKWPAYTGHYTVKCTKLYHLVPNYIIVHRDVLYNGMYGQNAPFYG